MHWMTTRSLRRMLIKAAATVCLMGCAALGMTVPANAAPIETGLHAVTDDPGCDTFGWRHPLCAGGAWEDGSSEDDETASQEWGPANIPNPVTPNGDTSMTFPGSPNTP